MHIFQTADELGDFLVNLRNNTDLSIGFVPTMGALHQGHLELINHAKKENDLVIASIFVNPSQFNDPNDYNLYPRTIEEDTKSLTHAGCDVVFIPSVETMYPEKTHTTFDFGNVSKNWEGAFRPGHFSGVGLVVSKLFNMVKPHKAYFGQKDLQQVGVIKQLVRDLSFQIHVRVVPTMREKDGLAMSSRNVRLTEKERLLAPQIFKALSQCKELLHSGILPDVAIQSSVTMLDKAFEIEYFSLINPNSFEALNRYEPTYSAALIIAVKLGNVRLIDNILL